MKSDNTNNQASLTRFAWLSIAAAVLTIALKTVAYSITGSVGLLSDALESIVNLVGASMALAMLTIAARPADEDHAYGHNKAEYFSSGVEGTLILVAAVSIGVAAVQRCQIAAKLVHEFAAELVQVSDDGRVKLLHDGRSGFGHLAWAKCEQILCWPVRRVGQHRQVFGRAVEIVRTPTV